MQIELKTPSADELISLHDLYALSGEPDAPKYVFSDLTEEEKTLALKLYEPDFHFSAYAEDIPIGFVGIYPDNDFLYVGLFYILKPEYRRQGNFVPLLRSAVTYAQKNYSAYQFIRALTRKENEASINGLMRCSFKHDGQEIQNVGQLITYEKYILPLGPSLA